MGYSQRQVARLLGLKCASRISRWESGERFPGIRNLIKLSILYHTLVDNLYYELRENIRTELEQAEGQVNESDKENSEEVKNRPP